MTRFIHLKQKIENDFVNPCVLENISNSSCYQQGIKLYLLRLDQTDNLISGNKWFKLKYNLQYARQLGLKHLLSFGGAWSNHIHALAAAANAFDFDVTGVIRGEPGQPLNPCLQDVSRWGMRLHFVSRKAYRKKTDPLWLEQLLTSLNLPAQNTYIIPEGGSNALAVKGCMEILDLIDCDYDYLCTACGTGGTLAGLACALQNDPARKQLLAYSALKGGDFFSDNIVKLIAAYLQCPEQNVKKNWLIKTDYHFGGYAKTSNTLMDFIAEFEQQYGITLDQVYTGKLLYGIFADIEKKYYKPGSTIIAIHSGGLQGRRSL